jgi:hypothetical protein
MKCCHLCAHEAAELCNFNKYPSHIPSGELACRLCERNPANHFTLVNIRQAHYIKDNYITLKRLKRKREIERPEVVEFT